MNISKKLGVKIQEDCENDETVYSLGSNNQMPIGLLLAAGSQYQGAVERFCYQYVYGKEAKQWALEIKNQLNFNESIEKIIKNFDANEKFPVKINSGIDMEKSFDINQLKPVSDKFLESYFNPSPDIPLPFHVYSEMFATILAKLTSGYGSGQESIVLECPVSYSNFWNRAVFQKMDHATTRALLHVVKDVMRVMEIKNISVNKKTMTVYVAGYQPSMRTQSMMF